jgi:hypothetical protein
MDWKLETKKGKLGCTWIGTMAAGLRCTRDPRYSSRSSSGLGMYVDTVPFEPTEDDSEPESLVEEIEPTNEAPT